MLPNASSKNQQHDQQWIKRALELARRGEALASPNPMVGAVLVRDGQLVGEGFHTYDGLRHAEILALEAAADRARGATLYVNLEPCCHVGRTAPCTRALASSGIARVVAAMPDPNPKVSGRGFRELRAAGIEVECIPSGDDAQRLNEGFALWIKARRPFVTLKTALTLDGSLVLPQSKGRHQRRWITSEASRAEVQKMRHASDAIVTGIGTVLVDNPLLTDRTGLLRRRRLLRVVLDSKLRLSPRSKLVHSADNDVLVFTTAGESSPRAKALRRAGVEILHVSERARRPDLGAVLAELGRREILSVILEAGATLNQAALDAGVVEKVRLFYAPVLAGNALSTANGSDQSHRLAHLSRPCRELAGVRIDKFGPDFAVEGYLRDVYRNR